LFSYRYRKPAYLLAFLTFNRDACVARFNPIEPNSEVRGPLDTNSGHRPNCPQANPTQSSCPCPVTEL